MRRGYLISALAFWASATVALGQAPTSLPASGAPAAPPTVPAAPGQLATPIQHGTIQTPPSSPATYGQAADYTDHSCCGAPNWYGQGPCGPPGRVWFGVEYLAWWVKDGGLPPLVTTGAANLAQAPPPGALGAPSTGLLFGGNEDGRPFSGARFTAGMWLNDCQTFGFEVNYLFLGSRSNDFIAGSSGAAGSTVLARPFLDLSTGLQNAELVAFPGLASGTVTARSTTGLQGAEANALCNVCCSAACCDACDPCRCCEPTPGYRLDLLGGFRWLQLREGLGIVEDIDVLPTAPIFAGDHIVTFDQFNTHNDFYGGQLGLRGEVWWNRLFANVGGWVALGDNHETVQINGATSVTSPSGATVVSQGGLLALPGNIGNYSHDRFSVVPEVDFNVGVQVTPNLRVFVGYTFLYWSDVVRPGDVIDLNVNSTRLPTSLIPPSGPATPPFVFRQSDFWAQGISAGLQLRF